MIHVGDLAQLIVTLAAGAPQPRTLTAADARPQGYLWREVLGAAARAVGNEAPRLFQAPTALLKTVALAGDIGRVFGAANMLSSQKLREVRHPDWSVSAEELARPAGWTPAFDIDRGFADAVTWYRKAGWLPAR
jgi:nucleoside-diphosphate-sugar epimerase